MNTLHSIDLIGAQFKNPLPKRHFKHRVLLVEDSQESEDLIRHICETVDGDMRLKCVKTAEEAQQLLRSHSHFDLIISDHFLAGQKTGLDLWRNCQRQFRQIPFMMTSSLTTEEFNEKIDPRRNHPRFLHKPFSKKDCLQMIQWYLEKYPEMERKIKVPKSLAQATDASRSLFKKIYSFLWVFGFLTLFAAPNQIQTVETFFTQGLRQRDSDSLQPMNTKIIEKTRPPVTPKKLIDFNDVFTPDILRRIARIEKRADEINKVLGFDSTPRPEKTVKIQKLANVKENLIQPTDIREQEKGYDVDVE